MCHIHVYLVYVSIHDDECIEEEAWGSWGEAAVHTLDG